MGAITGGTVAVFAVLFFADYYSGYQIGSSATGEDGVKMPWEIPQEEMDKLQIDLTELEGRYIYKNSCSSCHGQSGRGDGPGGMTLKKRPPDIGDENYKSAYLEPKAFKNMVVNGIPGTQMPPFGGLPDKQINALRSYILWLRSKRHLIEQVPF